MYGRAPRVMHVENKSTSTSLGPNSYFQPSDKKKGTASMAPFNSLSRRETFLDVSDRAMLAPGPAHYNADIRVGEAKRLTGHSVMASRSKRFDSSSTLPPGPGSYTVNVDVNGRPLFKTQPTTTSEAAPRPAQPTNMRQAVAKIVHKQQITAPSIPSTAQAYGYEEAGTGELRPQPVPKRDSTLGPAFYNPSHDQTEPTKRYHGNHFGKRTSKRFDGKVAGADVPPPGLYDVPGTTARPLTAPAHAKKPPAAELDIPRYHQLVPKQETKKNVPGPGSYNIGGDLANRQNGGEMEQPCLVPFGTQTRRFASHKEHGPPVGLYNDPRTSLQVVQKVTSKSKNPFGQSTARFKEQQPHRLPPGPTSYNLDHTSSIVESCIKKATVGRHGAFGSVSIRETDLRDREKSDLPGPAHYQREGAAGGVQGTSFDPPPPTAHVAKKRTSQFASQTNRLDKLDLKGWEAPPPGSYDIAASYEAAHGKRSQAKPTTHEANVRQKSFLGGQNRFSQTGLVVAKNRPDPQNPEPGRYRTEVYHATGSQNKQGMIVSTTERFDDPATFTPGPGAYQLHPSQVHSVLKGTHNATLNNPLIALQDEDHARPTRTRFSVGPV